MTTTDGTGAKRRIVDRLAGAVATRMLKLPAPTTDYRIMHNLRIPTRDGIELAADLFQPLEPPLGTLLIRGPYGRGLVHTVTMARPFAAAGYQVLFVSCRGTFGSGGSLRPFHTEADDGHDVVTWMREQDWYTGSFATIGASYLGYTQWALLADPPEDLRASVIVMAPYDYARHQWGTGTLNLDLLRWSDMVAHQEDGGLAALRHRLTAARALQPVFASVPLVDAADEHLAGRAPWFRATATHPDCDDPYWTPTRHREALERVSVPVLLIGGWQDIFAEQTLAAYTRLAQRGVTVGLTVGAWSHLNIMRSAGRITSESLQWLREHFVGQPADDEHPARSAPVQVEVAGADLWRDYQAWPPATQPHTFYLGPARSLATAVTETATPATFTFDPHNPTPTVGGPLLVGGGYRDDSTLSSRPDVLTFTSGLLTDDLEVLGAGQAVLHHVSDNPYADLFVRVSDVDMQGRSRNVTEAYLRLDPDRDDEPVTVPLRHTAHRFRAGHRVRLIIAGGSLPKYARNLGTDENPCTGTELKPAKHAIQVDAAHPSHVTLPVAT